MPTSFAARATALYASGSNAGFGPERSSFGTKACGVAALLRLRDKSFHRSDKSFHRSIVVRRRRFLLQPAHFRVVGHFEKVLRQFEMRALQPRSRFGLTAI